VFCVSLDNLSPVPESQSALYDLESDGSSKRTLAGDIVILVEEWLGFMHCSHGGAWFLVEYVGTSEETAWFHLRGGQRCRSGGRQGMCKGEKDDGGR